MPAKRKASVNHVSDERTPSKRRKHPTATDMSSRSPSSRGEHTSPPPIVKSPLLKLPRQPVSHSTPTKNKSDMRLTRSQSKVSAIAYSRLPSGVPLCDQSEDELALLTSNKIPNGKKSGQISCKVSQLPRVFVEIVSPAPRTPKHLTSRFVANPASPTPTRSRITRKLSPSRPSSPPSPTKVSTAKRTHPLRPIVHSTLDGGQSSLSHCLSKYPPSCLHGQKRAILHALHHPKTAVFNREDENGEPSANAVALQELTALLTGTVERGEGNSCLLIGPRGSGKSHLLEEAVTSLPFQPIIIRLSGHVQHNDRLALREIARQLLEQTGRSFDVESGLVGADDEIEHGADASDLNIPPPSYLPTLISALPTLARPTVLILESFDLFAVHGRQALLYCLLDTAQSCRADKNSKGIAVIGVTTRVDTINLLEKRVKSRFSGRMFRTAGPGTCDDWISIARNVFTVKASPPNEEWEVRWATAVEKLLSDRSVKTALADTYHLAKDVRLLCRILMGVVLNLSPANPLPDASQLRAAVTSQRYPAPFPFLSEVSYPAACLLIASVHTRSAGHESVTFEMLHDSFQKQVRTSQSAPVQVDGGSIGMVRCSKEVLMSAFELLTAARIFVCVTPVSAGTKREFVRYKCMVEKEDVRQMVSVMGQTTLNQWIKRGQ
ncbi:origin recognition complex subunit 4 C-terminus-domain-containing protein [Russula earlei]|uniref:Origin recognition complex subunit 4 C-terminus-domain-containing protein n=1 Tax=Russula earlei TaxID=71964 RepID=A0ACC0UNS6_9AGAM|nr:origin recognition complex subunit 4 C-terminus-domain-containing protein [Russula earlei]